MRVLVVEDEEELGVLIQEHLKRQGFAVDLVDCLEDAHTALSTTPFDAIVLDLNLPDGDGQGLIRTLRARRNWIPVLAATARGSVDQRIHSLDLGADDYLVKPFDLRELTARLRALLRRPSAALGARLNAGNVEFDTVTRAVTVNAVPINLHRRQLALLEILMRSQGRVASRSSIEDGMYGIDDLIESNAMESHVSRLRKTLADFGATLAIHTVRGVGYMLIEESP